MEKSWKDAIKRVLAEAGAPMHYTEISETILSRGYYKTDGATPAATVNSQVVVSIQNEGEKSPFIRVGRGIVALRTNITPKTVTANEKRKKRAPTTIDFEDDDTSQSAIRSLGMYWQRDLIVWKSDPRILGRQQAGSKAVDFGGQRGIYILYDHHTGVYVGRSIDRPMGRRLYEHTIDRLGGRWNRFSWFGLLDVTEDGQLKERPVATSLSNMIATLEALLIEALEPPQNRKRGDDFSAVEYIQDIDPEIKEREMKEMLHSIAQKMRGGS